MATDTPIAMAGTYAFGPFHFMPAQRTLLQGQTPVRVGTRALEILAALVAQPGEVITKRQLIQLAWPDSVVDDGNLKVNIATLRRALGDNVAPHRYIATVTGRGYRFVAPVQGDGSRTASSAGGTPPAAARHLLPLRTTRMFGRGDVIDALCNDLHRTRLLSIVGAGGIGKTTVALAVAERVQASLRDGACFIDLAPLRDAGMLPHVVATAMGLPAHALDMMPPLCGFLQDREMLLVIDNCEHVIDAAASFVNRILAAAGEVRVLVTSREPLLVPGERVRRLPGLAAPPQGTLLTAEASLSYPAVQLFATRAAERLDGYTVTDADAPLVADICRRLDGLALAIEFAATRMDAFSVESILQQLDDRFRLTLGRRAGPERQRTMLATLEWSYSLLSEEEALLLRAISVFAGAFDVHGAAAVTGFSSGQTAERLAQLAAKSLLSVDLTVCGPTWRLLEVTRSFSLEQLRACGREAWVRQAHASYLCTTLEHAGQEWTRRPAHEWTEVYGRTLDDLRDALTWLRRDAAHRSLRIRLTVAGLLLWNHFSLVEESRLHVSSAAEDVHAAGLSGSVFEMKLQLWLGGASMFTRGFRDQAMTALRRALEIAVAVGDIDYHLRALMMIGIFELFCGEHQAGLQTLHTFSDVAARHDPSVLPEADVHTAIGELFLGRLPASSDRLESLHARLKRQPGDYVVRYLSCPVVLVKGVLGQVLWLTGQPDSARRMAEAAICDAGALNHHLSLNNVLSYACPIYFWTGDLQACARCVEQLDDQTTRHGLLSRRPVARFFRAALQLRQQGPQEAAVEAMALAVEEFAAINHRARMPYYLAVLGRARADHGQWQEADATVDAALTIASEQGEDWCLPELLRVKAGLLAEQGHTEAAMTMLHEAIVRSRESGALSWRLRIVCDLARLLDAAERHGEALALVLPVFNAFTEGRSTEDHRQAAALITKLSESLQTATPWGMCRMHPPGTLPPTAPGAAARTS